MGDLRTRVIGALVSYGVSPEAIERVFADLLDADPDAPADACTCTPDQQIRGTIMRGCPVHDAPADADLVERVAHIATEVLRESVAYGTDTGSEHHPMCDGSCCDCPVPVPIQVYPDELAERVARALVEAAPWQGDAEKVEAWDEGYDAGDRDARAVQKTYPEPTRNPYRDLASRPAPDRADEGGEGHLDGCPLARPHLYSLDEHPLECICADLRTG